MANKHVRRYSAPYVFMELQIEIMRYNDTTIRMIKIQNMNKIQY